MSLDSIFQSLQNPPARATRALVLMGGGARTAYQCGVLRGLASMLRLQPGPDRGFPFQVLVGTSAGAMNAAFLASTATEGLGAIDKLDRFWHELRSEAVYRLEMPRWARAFRLAAAVRLWDHARRHGAVLDTMPLVNTLHRNVQLRGIDDALQAGVLHALAVTASSYTTGVHWTFCHTTHDRFHDTWDRPGRRAAFQPLTIEHLMASSAIPFLFPATPLWVDNRREFFGDGSMRQISPLSPALHLGASHILVIGVGQPQRAGMGGATATVPTFGAIAGHVLASVFHDTLQADVEQAQRVTATLRQLPPRAAGALPYRPVEVLALHPSQSLDAVAAEHLELLPDATRRALGGTAALSKGGPLASYLLFEPAFVQALIKLGEQDAYARKTELLTFLDTSGTTVAA